MSKKELPIAVRPKRTAITKDKPTPIDLNPTIKESVVISFGRMNPPTIGHKKLVGFCKEIAESIDADSKIYLSHTKDEDKNPLGYESKLKYCQEAFGDIIVESEHQTLHPILSSLKEEGYRDVIFVCGSDRVDSMQEAMNNINKYVGFDSIVVESCGMRDIDSDNLVEAVSSSMVRQYVLENDYESYAASIPEEIKDISIMFNEIYNGMRPENINESFSKYFSIDNKKLLDIIESIKEKEILSLQNKADKYNVSFNIVEEVFVRGLYESDNNHQKAFDRVNSFLENGKAAREDDVDLVEAQAADYSMEKVKGPGNKIIWRKVKKQLNIGKQ